MALGDVLRITHASAENFQSYKTIAFNYTDLGLTLVSGPTGSGKSTVLDLVMWTLYGQTSKQGLADDVCSWGATNLTRAVVKVDLPSGNICVFRTRGAPIMNDLYWWEANGTEHRGKDLTETQKLLEARLGVSAELFLLGSYITQFSQADSFFISKAKDRREVLERIADQEFAVKLGERASERRKDVKKQLVELKSSQDKLSGKILSLNDSLLQTKKALTAWHKNQEQRITNCNLKYSSFEADKAARIEDCIMKSNRWDSNTDGLIAQRRKLQAALPKVDLTALLAERSDLKAQHETLLKQECTHCGNLGGKAASHISGKLYELEGRIKAAHYDAYAYDEHELAIKDMSEAENPYTPNIAIYREEENPHGEQLVELKAEQNPHHSILIAIQKDLNSTTDAFNEKANELEYSNLLSSRLTWLYDKSFELRGILMEKVVRQVEAQTNQYLEKYFDAILRIRLTLADSDRLDVEIQNDGHITPFRQLSGGERCMLKLAFSLSIMRAAQDKAGVSFNMIMLDEALNGLDEELKAKAFALLQALSLGYPTVLCIDHSSELKQHFDNVVTVEKINGQSRIREGV